MAPVLIDSGNAAAKDNSSLAIQLNAETVNADFVLIVMEAWGLMKKHAPRHHEIVEEFGSIGKSPYWEDVVSFSLETNHGVWFGMAPIRPKPPSRSEGRSGRSTLSMRMVLNGDLLDCCRRRLAMGCCIKYS